MDFIIKLNRGLFVLIIFLFFSGLANAYKTEDFAKKSAYSNVKISPEGTHFGTVVRMDEKASLAVIDAKTFKVIGGAILPGNNEVMDYFWANNKRIVIQVGIKRSWEKKPHYYGELFAVNYDGSKGKMIYGYRAGQNQTGSHIKKTSSTYGWASIVDLLPDDEDNILVSSTKWSSKTEKFPSLHKLNINTGRLSRGIARSPIPEGTFVLGKDKKLKLVHGIDKDRNKLVYTYHPESDEKWKALPTNNYGSVFHPYTVTADNKSLYVLDDYKSDKTGLFKLSLSSGKLEKVYIDKEVDLTDVVQSTDLKTTYALKIDPDYPTYLMIDSSHKEAQLFKQLLATFPGNEINITSHSHDGRMWVIYTTSDISPGSYYLFDKKENQLRLIFKRHPHLKESELARTEAISFTARDKLKIHGYLTRPNKVESATKTPMVVLVHGGPHGPRDYWGYDPEVQLLASQGYSVLQVNFRGSGGYGYDFKEAGYLHWGDHIMQDIIDGTHWAIEQGKIDKDRICIMGASFGGYAAIQASTLAPDLYKCAITNVGISNLELMADSDIPDWYAGESYLEDVLGTDEAKIKAFSPVHHVSKLKGPVLIAHGKRDERVPFENAEQLEEALEEHGKEYETLYIDGEEHGFFNDKNRVLYFNTLSTFLKKHL